MNYQFKPIRTFSIFIFLFAILVVADAQNFGDIDPERLAEEVHPMDADASHAYILKNSHVYYDRTSPKLRIISEIHYRIKIYKDDGVDEANIVKYLYRDGGEKESIRKIKATCYNLVDGKIEKTKLSKKEIYKEELDERRTKVSFAVPNVRAGSIIEFSYRVSSPFIYSFPRHYFQTNVPVDYSRMKVDVPDYFTMAPTASGMVPLNRKEEVTTSYGYPVTRFTFDASDIPGIDDDKYVLDIDDYRSSLKYELSQIAIRGQKVHNFTKDWNSICTNLHKSKRFGKILKKRVKQAEDLMVEIASMSDKEKLYRIVDFINSNIVWDGELGLYANTSHKKLFEAKKGNVGDINLLLINLCREAGLVADPVLTKSRFYGVLNTSYPSLVEINYVFALVEVDGKEMYVDATSPYHEPGDLPLRALNISGVLMLGELAEVITLSNNNLNYFRQAGKYTLNLEDEKLDGQGKFVMKGYASVRARKKHFEEDDNEDEQDLIKSVDDEDDGLSNDEDEEEDDEDEEEDFEDEYVYSDTKGLEDKYGNLITPYESSLYSPFEQIGNEIYIDAFVTLEFEENPFLDEVRRYPAFFNSKHHINHVSILEIPEGYSLKSKPENQSIKIVNDKGWLTYTINEAMGILTVNVLFKLDHDIFMPGEYASLYAFFDRVLELQKEKIVLVKN